MPRRSEALTELDGEGIDLEDGAGARVPRFGHDTQEDTPRPAGHPR